MFEKTLVREMVEREIPFTVKGNVIVIDGFYKSGTVTLVPIEGEDAFEGTARYDEKRRIENVLDLASWNMVWWEASCNRGVEEWVNPAEPWATIMAGNGWVKREEKVVVTYK